MTRRPPMVKGQGALVDSAALLRSLERIKANVFREEEGTVELCIRAVRRAASRSLPPHGRKTR